MSSEQLALQGRPVKGTLNSADLTTAAIISLFNPSDHSAEAVASDEHLAIDWITVVTDTATSVRVFFKDDATPTDAGTLVRGDFSANGGIGAFSYPLDNPPRGRDNDDLRAIAGAAGNVNITFGGRIKKTITKTGPVGAPIHDPLVPYEKQ